MSAVAERLEAGISTRRRSGLYWDAYRRLRRNRIAEASIVLIAGFVVVAALAPVIAPHDPTEQFLRTGVSNPDDPLAARDTGKYEAPSRDHIFGTDQLGRDIFSRTILGLRVSLAASLFAIVVVTVIGVTVGLAAGGGPKYVDALLMRATDIAFAFPDLLLIILLRATFGDALAGRGSVFGIEPNVLLLFLAISLTAWPTMARLLRGQILSIREEEYTLAARAIGVGGVRLATRHWLPNALGPVIVEITFLVPRAIFAEATLSFIGLGVTPPTPSLGSLIHDHFDFVQIQWTGLFFPTAVLAVLFLAFQFLGDGLRDALDPRSR